MNKIWAKLITVNFLLGVFSLVHSVEDELMFGNFRSLNLPNQNHHAHVDGREFPLILSPSQPLSSSDIPKWIDVNRENIMQLMLSHGAVLLRGFPIDDPSSFSKLSLGLDLIPHGLKGSAAPRSVVPNTDGVVFTSNESPPESTIPFHHEMAQTINPPSYVLFYCDQPSATGGATPIVLSEEVVRFVDENFPSFAQNLRKRGVRYHRTLPDVTDGTSALGKSWKATLNVETEEEAAQVVSTMSESWEFDKGLLRTTSHVLPGITRDPRTGREVFFNQIVAAYFGWSDARNLANQSVTLGGPLGSPKEFLDPEAMKAIADFMERQQVIIPWEENDVLLIDNRVVLHSRQPYTNFEDPTKRRRIMASLWGRRKRHPTVSPFLGEEVNRDVLVLRSNDVMPKIGLGTWKIPNNVTADVVFEAIKIGYRHIDCAADYGNEKEVGDGIRRAMQLGLVKREELWVVSKLWNNYHSAEHVPLALDRTLRDLGLDYLDLYMVHFPIATQFIAFEDRYPPGWVGLHSSHMELARVPMSETWGAMEEMVSLGKVRNIGLCNVNTAGLRDVLSYSRIPPAVLQVERHPYLQQSKLLKMCREMGIAVVGFSPLGAGSYVELCMAQEEDTPLTETIVTSIAESKNKTPAQVVLRWGMDSGIGIIPKSSKVERLRENLELSDFSLTPQEMQAFEALDQGRRFNDPGEFTTGMNSFCPIYD